MDKNITWKAGGFAPQIALAFGLAMTVSNLATGEYNRPL
jgi:hypothetical protein